MLPLTPRTSRATAAQVGLLKFMPLKLMELHQAAKEQGQDLALDQDLTTCTWAHHLPCYECWCSHTKKVCASSYGGKQRTSKWKICKKIFPTFLRIRLRESVRYSWTYSTFYWCIKGMEVLKSEYKPGMYHCCRIHPYFPTPSSYHFPHKATILSLPPMTHPHS